jgi:ribosomal protein S12
VVIIFWWPTTHKANRLRGEIESRQRELASSEYTVNLAKAFAVADQQMSALEKKLDASVSQGVLVQNIAVLARQHNVKIVSVAYEDGKVVNGYVPLVHVLTVQADYAQLRSFIAGLEQLPTFTVAQEAILTRAANSSVIKAQLNIITYRREREPNK